MTIPNLDELALHSNYPAFHSNNTYSGSFTISGTTSEGYNQKTFTVTLLEAPDLIDVRFNGKGGAGLSGAVDSRPDDDWFKRGQIHVLGNNASLTNYPVPFLITYKFSGLTMTITASFVQTFSGTLNLTSTNGYYEIVDYSVFD